MAENKNKIIDTWVFIALVFSISLALRYFCERVINIPVSTIPIFTGILGFLFWIFVYQRPITDIYSQIYPYRKLKPWGWLSSFIFFEYVLTWGLYTKQLELVYENFYLIIVIFIGAIAFYFSFVRMKVSLRFLFLGIFIPILASGCAIGLGKYFGFIKFSLPKDDVVRVIFLNTLYWVLFNTLYQLVCEEPAFRGFLVQRLTEKGRAHAVIISSIVYATWHVIIILFPRIDISKVAICFLENFVIGCLLALLFIKGKNLLISAVSGGIIDGLNLSIFAGDRYFGLSQYFQMTQNLSELKFIILWLGCLAIGIALVLMIPEKRRPQVILARR